MIETLLELRNDKVEIWETENVVGERIDALLEGKSSEYIEVMLLGRGDNANIDVEVIKRLSRIDNIQLSAYNISTVERALLEYPEIRDAALKLLEAHSLPEGEIEEIVEKANKSAESKGVITIAQESKKGDMIDKLFERHATSIDILRVAHETKDYKVRYKALIILSKAGNLDVAFQVTPHALETVVEELGNSELMQVSQEILTKKITDPYLKRIASGILFLKVPNLFSLQDVVRILDQEGVSDPVIRQRALDMLAKSRSLDNVQAGYPTAQVVVAAINDPSSVKSAEILLIAFRIGNRGVKRDIIRALISEKIILDIKGDVKNRDQVIAILKSISNKQEGMQILSDIVNNDIDPRIVKEADSLLKKNASNNAIPVFGAIDTRGGFTGVRFFRSLLYSI
ncbi:MAG: hypothetical protein Q8N76_00690 [Candidatus Omnitrophota bacterium]|nr:hypothetical protein [Candidatus Omnitrophota bacterium]